MREYFSKVWSRILKIRIPRPTIPKIKAPIVCATIGAVSLSAGIGVIYFPAGLIAWGILLILAAIDMVT